MSATKRYQAANVVVIQVPIFCQCVVPSSVLEVSKVEGEWEALVQLRVQLELQTIV